MNPSSHSPRFRIAHRSRELDRDPSPTASSDGGTHRPGLYEVVAHVRRRAASRPDAGQVVDRLEADIVSIDKAFADDTTGDEHASDQNHQVPGSP